MSEPATLRTPLAEADARALVVGQEVLVSGLVVTARDAAHRYLARRPQDDQLPFDLAGAVIYHCGPIMSRTEGGWEVVSAGPTTSGRMEMYEPQVILRYGVRAIIGKGGMGAGTAKALSEMGAVYLTAASGAGALLAKRITKVEGVAKLEEFGVPEAMWALRVEDFPAIVAMDAHGGNIYTRVEEASAQRLHRLRTQDPRD